jgi:hypothetical protein
MIVTKTKSQFRAETADAVAKFLKSGGSIETIKPRKAPTTKMRGKNSRGFVQGSSGFANGFPRKTGLA